MEWGKVWDGFVVNGIMLFCKGWVDMEIKTEVGNQFIY